MLDGGVTMSLQKRFSEFKEPKIKEEENVIGVYEIANRERSVVYIGRTRNMKDRLLDHLNGKCTGEKGYYYRNKITNDIKEAERLEDKFLEEFQEEHGRLPECNEKSD